MDDDQDEIRREAYAAGRRDGERAATLAAAVAATSAAVAAARQTNNPGNPYQMDRKD